MATYNYPTTATLRPARAVLRQFHNNQASRSPLSGFVQTSSLPGARWGWSVEWPSMPAAERAALEGILTRLSGQEHRLRLWDFKRRVPRGTIQRTGVTASVSPQFGTTLTLNGCGANTTLLAGDWLAVNGQLLMCVVDAQASGGGVMSVEVRHMLRAAVPGGSAVTLVEPTALYILASSTLDLSRESGPIEGPLAAEFVEVFA